MGKEMKAKKLIVILIAVAFILCVGFSCFYIFTINKVDVQYKAADKTDTAELQAEFGKYVGKNLLFFNSDKVVEDFGNRPYFKVVAVNKKFPNVLSVLIEERKEVYCLEYDGSLYVMDGTGFVLKKCAVSEKSALNMRKIIELSFSNINVLSIETGSVIRTDSDAQLQCVFEMADAVNLYDCVKAINIANDSLEDKGALFYTYAGGTINVWNVMKDGVLKIKTVMVKYDVASDYVKSCCNIAVFTDSRGVIRVQGLDVE